MDFLLNEIDTNRTVARTGDQEYYKELDDEDS